MLGIFSCPAGAKVSWSRAPPPKVMTMILRFAIASAPHTSGLPLTSVVPRAILAAPRRKSRRLQPMSLASSLALVAPSFMAWLPGRLWRRKQIAAPRSPPCPIEPDTAPAAAGSQQIPAGQDPSFQRGRSTGGAGSGRREDSDSAPQHAHTPEKPWHHHADRHRDCPAGNGHRQSFRPTRSTFATEIRPGGTPGSTPRAFCPSTNSGRNKTGPSHCSAEVQNNGEISGPPQAKDLGKHRKRGRETGNNGCRQD